jgi:hypothetical protein
VPRLAGLLTLSLTAGGRSAYALAGDGRVVALARAGSGALTALSGPGSCLAWHVRLGCARVSRLEGAFKALASANGRSVYVLSDYGSLVEDTSAGAVITLTRASSGRIRLHHGSASCLADLGRGCRSLPQGHYVDLVEDPTGHRLWLSGGPTYKGSFTSTSTRAISVGSDASLSLGARTTFAPGLVFSANGRRAFGLGDTLDVFTRNPADGSLTPASPGCIEEPSPGFSTTCVSARGMISPAALAVSPDSQNLYVAAFGSNGLAAFALGAP